VYWYSMSKTVKAPLEAREEAAASVYRCTTSHQSGRSARPDLGASQLYDAPKSNGPE
jgi:hypothetical protein